MKKLEEIKNEVAFQNGYVDWECFRADCDWADQEPIINEVAKRYATEAIKADRERVKQEIRYPLGYIDGKVANEERIDNLPIKLP